MKTKKDRKMERRTKKCKEIKETKGKWITNRGRIGGRYQGRWSRKKGKVDTKIEREDLLVD